MWNLVQVWSFTKKISVGRCELTRIRLFYRKLSSRKRGNLSVFHINSRKYSNNHRGKLDSSWQIFRLKMYGERNIGLRTITATSYKQPNKLSQLQNIHSIEFNHSNFPCYLKLNRDKFRSTRRIPSGSFPGSLSFATTKRGRGKRAWERGLDSTRRGWPDEKRPPVHCKDLFDSYSFPFTNWEKKKTSIDLR